MKTNEYLLPEGVLEPIDSGDESSIIVQGHTYNTMEDDVWHFMLTDKSEYLKAIDLAVRIGIIEGC